METSAKSVVEKMYAAFASRDIEKFAATVSADTVWIYHGSQVIPRGVYEGIDGARAFIKNIIDKTEIISFEPLKFISVGEMVVVICKEHQRVKKTGKELKQQWVQILK